MVWEQRVFLLSAALLVYTWIVYPGMLWFLQKIYTPRAVQAQSVEKPRISIIVPAHNEEERIRAKLTNCLKLAYPHDRVEILVVSDGSADSTEEIVKSFTSNDSRIHLLRSERLGKSLAQNLAVQRAKGEILLFTDANAWTRPDLLEVIGKNFRDPRVGMVTATVYFGQPGDAVARGQGLYWCYELFLRAAESAIGILATGSGQALAMRRSLFRPMEACYGDDCVLPLDVRLQGYRVVQDSQAVVYDEIPSSIEGELRARVRMTARNWTGTLSRPSLFNPFDFP